MISGDVELELGTTRLSSNPRDHSSPIVIELKTAIPPPFLHLNPQSLFISPSFSSDHISVDPNILLVVRRARHDACLTNSKSANFRVSTPRHCFPSISFSLSLRHSLSLPRFPLTVPLPQPQFPRRPKLSAVRPPAISQRDCAFISSVARASLEFGLTESHPPNLDTTHELCANINTTADTRQRLEEEGEAGWEEREERGSCRRQSALRTSFTNRRAMLQPHPLCSERTISWNKK
ncbi:hypothetical protein BLNAU_6932 [Blattamonas nauphoetae]|uniref:Uncharacterized protein n=1 Tax=Blattamonas nauphoetae TaxID=2049346 RepID=A0ABQ9Y2N1_9EUKA|nr:hypothetical protein BLNAU_6932 [Blattamonas nauphoetae]